MRGLVCWSKWSWERSSARQHWQLSAWCYHPGSLLLSSFQQTGSCSSYLLMLKWSCELESKSLLPPVSHRTVLSACEGCWALPGVLPGTCPTQALLCWPVSWAALLWKVRRPGATPGLFAACTQCISWAVFCGRNSGFMCQRSWGCAACATELSKRQ